MATDGHTQIETNTDVLSSPEGGKHPLSHSPAIWPLKLVHCSTDAPRGIILILVSCPENLVKWRTARVMSGEETGADPRKGLPSRRTLEQLCLPAKGHDTPTHGYSVGALWW